MERRSTFERLVQAFRRHERTLVVVSLACLVLLGGLVSVGVKVDRVRAAVLDRVEKVVTYWDDRWTRRVEQGERLVQSGRYVEAAAYLTTLDRDFPARHVKHKRDIERERVLRALARSYTEMGRKRFALDTYRRLVEFDPRNFENHYLLAMACLRFREPIEAKEHLDRVRAIHPTHLPSTRASVALHFQKGDFAAVVAAYETYLDAFLLQRVTVALGEVSTTANVPVDGHFHDVEVGLSRPPKWSGQLTIRTGGFSIEIERVTIEAPLVVGRTGIPTSRVWPGESSWQVQEMAPVGVGLYRALGSGAVLRLDVPRQPRGIAKARLRLRLFKILDSKVWDNVEKSYRNLLKHDDLAAVRARSISQGSDGPAL